MREGKPVKRRGLLLVPKLEVEGTPAEEHIILGWILNTRLLLILLPVNKYEAWPSNTRAIMLTRQTMYGELKATLNWLKRVGYIITLVPLPKAAPLTDP
jgi:hypothetical protein